MLPAISYHRFEVRPKTFAGSWPGFFFIDRREAMKYGSGNPSSVTMIRNVGNKKSASIERLVGVASRQFCYRRGCIKTPSLQKFMGSFVFGDW